MVKQDPGTHHGVGPAESGLLPWWLFLQPLTLSSETGFSSLSQMLLNTGGEFPPQL